MKKNSEDIGYVISNTPYREYDAMVLFLGENFGLFRYVLRGYHKPKAKQTSLGLEFTKVKLRFDYKENSLQSIKSGELLESYRILRSDYDWLTQMTLFTELLTRFYNESHQNFWIKETASMFEEISLEKITVFLSKLIKDLGITPIVDYCVITKSQSVSDFSIEKGGFVSKTYRKTGSNIDLNMLKMIRYLFVTESINIDVLHQFKKTYELANLLIRYIEYYEGIKINSWKLID